MSTAVLESPTNTDFQTELRAKMAGETGGKRIRWPPRREATLERAETTSVRCVPSDAAPSSSKASTSDWMRNERTQGDLRDRL